MNSLKAPGNFENLAGHKGQIGNVESMNVETCPSIFSYLRPPN